VAKDPGWEFLFQRELTCIAVFSKSGAHSKKELEETSSFPQTSLAVRSPKEKSEA
jgi:hypothetical protein